MKLASLQRQFLGTITATGNPDDTPWPASQRAGIAVYRNAYRARLIECLRATYPKCLAWAGEGAFDAAASHHVILNPPQSWTLDAVGQGFDNTLGDLFRDNPELAELAWLEWTMGTVFTASDRPQLDAAGFATATANYTEKDWSALTFIMAPELRLRSVAFDPAQMWEVTTDQPFTIVPTHLASPRQVAVWRSGVEAKFRLLDEGEEKALELAAGGSSLEEICTVVSESVGAEIAAQRCGCWLSRWIDNGFLEGVPLTQ